MTVMRTSEAIKQFGAGKVRHAIASGRWQRPARGVVVTHNGPLSLAEQRLVALMVCAPGSVLGGLDALELDGFTGFTRKSVYVVLPEGADKPSHPNLITHWSTELSPADVHPTGQPPRTRPARSAVDAAAWTNNDRYARAIVIAAFQQRLINAAGVQDAIGRRGNMKRRAIVVESVFDARGGIQSLPERDFGEICRQIGLPRPSRQRKVKGPNGHYHLDAAWADWQIAVEIHGLPHHGILRWDADLMRANEVVITGPRLLIFTSYAVRHEQSTVADQLIRMFRAAGWQGHIRSDLWAA